MSPTEEKLLKAIKEEAVAKVQAELVETRNELRKANVKLKKALEQRDDWRYQARKYRDTILGKKNDRPLPEQSGDLVQGRDESEAYAGTAGRDRPSGLGPSRAEAASA